MLNKKISIVIPTFNRADYLQVCIDSCINQTIECEIIVCDHGSSDNTPDVVKKYGNRIKYVRREIDSGVHFCWLDGILHAKNDLIHINYDDDWIEPNFIESCINLFDDSVGCVFTDAIVYFEDTKKYSEPLFKLKSSTGVFPSKILLQQNHKDLTSPGAGVFRKQILLDNLFVGKIPFSKNEYHGVGPDLLFSLMSCVAYPNFGFVNEPLATFRAHSNSITIDSQSDKKKMDKINKAYDDARIYYLIDRYISKFSIYELIRKYRLKKLKKNKI
jgi:glycosyltransferase involved in cell wall biosynthesis